MTATAGEGGKKFERARWLVIVSVLVVLGLVIGFVTHHLRRVIQKYITERDGIVLHAASLLQETEADPELRQYLLEQKAVEATEILADKVVGLRIFDRAGKPQFAIPPDMVSRELTPGELTRLETLESFSSFDPAANLSEIFPRVGDSRPAPLLRAIVPLRDSAGLNGAAEFILDGRDVARAFSAVDRELWRYVLLTFLGGGLITSGSIHWALGRLQKTNALLARQTESLLRANHELTLAAKTSAVGAITAHLIHDLKNPLFGLQSFVSTRGSADAEDWDTAIHSAQRMQKVVGEIVRILQEEKTSLSYEISIEELLEILRGKLEPQARAARIEFRAETRTTRVLSNRDGNIILLILTNLAQNAIQATPAGGAVRVLASGENGETVFQISDTGPGLPELVRESIFVPCRSSKSGGTGLGLAISKQLANHIGAELLLAESTSRGTTFQLRVPERLAFETKPFESARS